MPNVLAVMQVIEKLPIEAAVRLAGAKHRCRSWVDAVEKGLD
jgi:hypothetical protein